MLLDQLAKPSRPRWVGPPALSPRSGWAVPAGPADAEYLATPSFRDTQHARSHASDVFRSKGYSFNTARKISLSRSRSPIFCLSFLIGSAFRAS